MTLPVLNDTDRRQLLAAFKVRAESSQFKATFTKALRFWRDPEDGLENQRTSLNYFVVELLRQFRVDTDGLYPEMDHAWEASLEEGRLWLIRRKGKRGLWWLVYSWNPELAVIYRTLEYRETWKAYKRRIEDLLVRRAGRGTSDG